MNVLYYIKNARSISVSSLSGEVDANLYGRKQLWLECKTLNLFQSMNKIDLFVKSLLFALYK